MAQCVCAVALCWQTKWCADDAARQPPRALLRQSRQLTAGKILRSAQRRRQGKHKRAGSNDSRALHRRVRVDGR